MNIKVIQPPYPWEPSEVEDTVSFILNELSQCDNTQDVILLPECCNAPSGCADETLLRKQVDLYTDTLTDAVRDTAARCGAIVGINLYLGAENNLLQNTTLLFDREGHLRERYVKGHLPISEYRNPAIDHSYFNDVTPPLCVEIEGVRYAFLTCYDIYYTEYINRLAIEHPDIVLVSSMQRAERMDILAVQAVNCAFICNSYVVRSSYSMGRNSKTGGSSLIAAPDGKILENLGQNEGSISCEIKDIKYKYMRSNGFGEPNVTNDYFQTAFRRPWSYRAGGSGVRPADAETPFPRLCAHRGYIQGAPENTIPSIAIAISMGAIEVETDVRPTRDGVLVISHDPHVERLTDETGKISEMSYEELMRLDPGKKFSSNFTGVRYATLEEIFKTFPSRTIFNLHVKPLDNVTDYSPIIRQIINLAERYDCMEHFYFASESEGVLEAAESVAPEIPRCALSPEVGYVTGETTLTTAIKYHCTRMQSLGSYLTDDVIKKAHGAGLRINLFSSEDVEDAKKWLARGVDTILTDNYLSLSLGLGIH